MESPSLADFGIGRLFDLVPDPVIVGDMTDGSIVAWNAAAAEAFGYGREEGQRVSLDSLVPERLRDGHRTGLAAYRDGRGGGLVGSTQPVEVPGRRADGQEIWVELKLAGLDAPGEPRRYVVAVLRDVTDRKRAQDETLAALAQVQQANKTVHDFVQMLSHDLRSPLAAVQTALVLLATRADRLSPEQRLEITDAGRRQAVVALGLVDDLLDLTRLESGQLRSAPEACDVEQLVRAAVETAGVDCEQRYDGSARVWADPGHVQRVLVNLLTNAAKYGKPPVVLEVRSQPDAVEVSVTDHGDGVPEDLVPTLFDKFTRAEGTGQLGVGLGLAIVDALTRVNDAQLRYDHPDGAGARFTACWRRPDEA